LSKDDFRRQLNDAFDDIAGSPSPALRDRVRSSISEAPEERGPYWIAAVAAAVLAVAIVGVLFVYNPLSHHPVPVGPAPSPTPSASPSASPAASPTPSASPGPTGGPFVCGPSAPITNSKAPVTAFIDGVRTGAHAGYDQLTVQFNNGQPSSIDLAPQANTNFTLSPSGIPVTLAGQNGILVTIHGADAHTAYTGARDIKTGYRGLVEVRVVQDSEGVVQLGLGISGPACYRAFILTGPTRFVIYIQTS
jgi:hypothetical protein